MMKKNIKISIISIVALALMGCGTHVVSPAIPQIPVTTQQKSESEITIYQREYIGGVAGTEYTDSNKISADFSENEVVYEDGDFNVKAHQSEDGSGVVLEFSDRVFVEDSGQKIEKELLEKKKRLTVNYPMGTGGIELTFQY